MVVPPTTWKMMVMVPFSYLESVALLLLIMEENCSIV